MPDELADKSDDELVIYFNPFQFTIEENNAFLAKGWRVMPMRIPDARP